MKILHQADTLHITDLKDLGAGSAQSFKEEVRAALPGGLHVIEIDLSQTAFVDSCGLGALIAIYKTASSGNSGNGHGNGGGNSSCTLRLVNPTPPVQQLLELTRMHRLFEIIHR